jgi:hypothetical protein
MREKYYWLVLISKTSKYTIILNVKVKLYSNTVYNSS